MNNKPKLIVSLVLITLFLTKFFNNSEHHKFETSSTSKIYSIEQHQILPNITRPQIISDNNISSSNSQGTQKIDGMMGGSPSELNNSLDYQVQTSNLKEHNKTSMTGVKYLGQESVTLNKIVDPLTGQNKIVNMIKLQLSDNFKDHLRNKTKKILAKLNDAQTKDSEPKTVSDYSFTAGQSLSDTSKFDLGMANVKVFDQGQHGTCATFATTAALDAKMNAGDFISQQCTLELGVDIEKNYFNEHKVNKEDDQADPYLSGWDGYNGNDVVLSRLKKYGVVSNQLCPHAYGDEQLAMTPDEYSVYSKSTWTNEINWKPVTQSDKSSDPSGTEAINNIKNILRSGHRIVCGILLDTNNANGDAINATYSNGLWKLPTAEKLKSFIDQLENTDIGDGHEIIITGYDDTNRVFKVRNSWGTEAGENGDFYMTYDYYYLLNDGAEEIL